MDLGSSQAIVTFLKTDVCLANNLLEICTFHTLKKVSHLCRIIFIHVYPRIHAFLRYFQSNAENSE